MGQANRFVSGNNAPLRMNGELIEGVVVVNVPGKVSQTFQVRDTLSTAIEVVPDLPAAGVASFTVNFNSADPVHRKLKQYQDGNDLVGFEWLVEGQEILGVKSKTAEQIGEVNVTGVSNAGVLTYGSFTIGPPKIGDHLEHADNENLIVVSADYSNASGVRLNVTQLDGTNPSAVAAAADYVIKKPAQMQKFAGRISGVPKQGGQVIVATVQIALAGEVQEIVGTPDLA